MEYDMPVFRPPSEANSVIIQATLGCSHNKCTFCGMYKMKKFRVRSPDDIKKDMSDVAAAYPQATRVFFADGDALCLETDVLRELIAYAFEVFPRLERVAAYATPQDLLEKSDADLQKIADAGLTMIYLGVESGDDDILKSVNKGVDSAAMIDAGKKARRNGLILSTTVLLGLGGKARTYEHAKNTARALNEIRPEYSAFLMLMLVPETVLYRKAERGEFVELTPQELLQELRWIVEDLAYKTVFRANHASNYLPLRAELPEEKEALLATIDEGIRNPERLKPGYLRGL